MSPGLTGPFSFIPACRRFCPSQICNNGACAGTTPGDVLFIGHDYQVPPAGAAQAISTLRIDRNWAGTTAEASRILRNDMGEVHHPARHAPFAAQGPFGAHGTRAHLSAVP